MKEKKCTDQKHTNIRLYNVEGVAIKISASCNCIANANQSINTTAQGSIISQIDLGIIARSAKSMQIKESINETAATTA